LSKQKADAAEPQPKDAQKGRKGEGEKGKIKYWRWRGVRSGYTAIVDASQLFLSLFLSTIGIVYFMIGRKRSSMPFMFCGLALMGFSYFMGSLWLSLLIGAILTLIPLYFR